MCDATVLNIPHSYDSITNVIIHEGATSIEYGAFVGCDKLASVTIPSSVTNMGGRAFSGCSRLMRVDISDLAKWCEIEFGSFDANPLYYAKHLYLNGDEVKNVTIPEGAAIVGAYAFEGCKEITSVTFPSSVTSIGASAFSGCCGLTSVAIPEGVISIGDLAFSGCCCLSAISIPSSVRSIGNDAFSGCTGLGEGVVIRNGCVLCVNGACPEHVVIPEGVQ